MSEKKPANTQSGNMKRHIFKFVDTVVYPVLCFSLRRIELHIFEANIPSFTNVKLPVI